MRKTLSVSRARLIALAGAAAVLYALGGCSNTKGDLKSAAHGAMAALVVSNSPAPAPGTASSTCYACQARPQAGVLHPEGDGGKRGGSAVEACGIGLNAE